MKTVQEVLEAFGLSKPKVATKKKKGAKK